MKYQASAVITSQGGAAETIAAAAAGDRDAFGTLYNEHRDMVFHYLHRRTGNWALAEDLTQDTFVRALKHVSTFSQDRAGGGVAAWLHTIARNLHLDHLKRAAVQREVLTPPGEVRPSRRAHADSSSEPVMRRAAAADAAKRVHALMDALSPDQRRCIEMRLLGLTRFEIAAVLELPHNTVGTRTQRAIIRMRQAAMEVAA
ncbi:sigma-70 family RNA polymerase sigma factor [Streptomyces griseoviridis]|uniref:RNA polymerase sigma factor n=1 Tax=Streptomyces griseoviridis TaxID=45398 RepID=UPI00344D2A08